MPLSVTCEALYYTIRRLLVRCGEVSMGQGHVLESLYHLDNGRAETELSEDVWKVLKVVTQHIRGNLLYRIGHDNGKSR